MKFGISYPIPEILKHLHHRCDGLKFLVEKYPEIQHICAFNNVKELYLIGPAVQAQFKEGDSIEFIVDFTSDDHIKRSTLYMALKTDLSEILNKNINLYDLNYSTEDCLSLGQQNRLLLYKSR